MLHVFVPTTFWAPACPGFYLCRMDMLFFTMLSVKFLNPPQGCEPFFQIPLRTRELQEGLGLHREGSLVPGGAGSGPNRGSRLGLTVSWAETTLLEHLDLALSWVSYKGVK